MTGMIIAFVLGGILSGNASVPGPTSGLASFDIGYTMTKVRIARAEGRSYVAASSYEGTLLGMSFDGAVLWTNKLSGFMNHDLWCEDMNGDGRDEVLAANADGSVYCLDSEGALLWTFKPSVAPMNAVCVVRHGNARYVVCGGYDKNIYYLSAEGRLVKTISSATYSVEKPWGRGVKPVPGKYRHTANFIRKIRMGEGREAVCVHGVIHSLSARGSLYLFDPLAGKPFKTIKITQGKAFGELRACDVDQDGMDEILLGSSSMIQDAMVVKVDIGTGHQTVMAINGLSRKVDRFGYRVAQPIVMGSGKGRRVLVLFGSRILAVPADLSAGNPEILACKYAFNDMWTDPAGGRMILASSQSGGSCIHVLDLQNPGWKAAYAGISPPGKIEAILRETGKVRAQLQQYKPCPSERAPLPVYLMTERIPDTLADLANRIKRNFKSPLFLKSVHMGGAENWDRSSLANDMYRNRRDRRRKYNLTRTQVLNRILPNYGGAPGISFWGGHGNDPYMFSRPTLKKILDAASGRKTVLIFPELEGYGKDFASVLDHHIYPLTAYCRGKNANLYIRSKHTFWMSIAYLPMWSRLLSGEYADVFVPAMEETSDKSMELSLAARLGVWASGATDSWGARCARDNPSFDRLRQHSHQMLPNHFLRTMIYNIACGARYINNFPVDQKYMSLLWELIARGVLYVPKPSEIVSFSPVHVSMTGPDEHFLHEGNNVKWTTFFDADFEADNPFVFSRLNGSWPGAPVTRWDFSRYAAGVKDRRLNFLPPYEHGLVLITPVQGGAFAAKDAPRGALEDHLHPLYKGILKEYITDGRFYYSADGSKKFRADEHAGVIEAAIKKNARLLPLTVSGGVAWVAAQTGPNHLRLTLIDGGYINPGARQATVSFHTIRPLRMKDLLSGEVFDVSRPSDVKVNVPCGMFRFIDIELKEVFGKKT